MIKTSTIFVFLLFTTLTLKGQTNTAKGKVLISSLKHKEVKQVVEVESLFPMFFFGGYHFSAGYRYKKFRLRASVISGGIYNVEPSGVNNSSANFKRYYKPSPGIFIGYNVWKNLELYTYVEKHTFSIEQKSTNVKEDIRSTDFGGGVGYQFFVGRYFYVQPALHLYLRRKNSIEFSGIQYNIPTADVSPVIRIGARLWSRY